MEDTLQIFHFPLHMRKRQLKTMVVFNIILHIKNENLIDYIDEFPREVVKFKKVNDKIKMLDLWEMFEAKAHV